MMTSLVLLAGLALAQEPSAGEALPAPEALVESPATPPTTADLDALRAEIARLDAELAEVRALVADRPPEATAPARRVAAASGGVRVAPDEEVEQAVAFGEDVVVLGRVLGNATAFGGDVRVLEGGAVEGDAVSFGGRVIVEDGARVHGDRISSGRVAPDLGASGLLSALYNRLVFLLSFAGAGVLLVGLFPDRVSRIAEAIEGHPVRSAVVGLISSGLLVGASVLFAVTLIGIPITLLLVGLLGLAWLLGFVALCQAVGDRLPFQQKVHGRWAAFLGGALLVTFLGVLPFVGWLTVVAFSILGLGAALSTRMGGRR